jgi:two-component sensor histidine kinase
MLGDEGKVSVSCHAQACYLPTQEVIPVALIANELITNAFKYGYPDGGGGAIRVTCEKEEGAIVLTVSDDGTALPADFEPAASNGLGMKMITSLAKQLRATLDIVRLDPGKAFRLRVPNSEI